MDLSNAAARESEREVEIEREAEGEAHDTDEVHDTDQLLTQRFPLVSTAVKEAREQLERKGLVDFANQWDRDVSALVAKRRAELKLDRA